ncbi:MAG: nuclear transport factor 2 family protein [Micavibrio sp.]|nr:nuclear transport factor 2 family protein [Micavibrio sp.]
MTHPLDDALKRYIAFYETLSPETLPQAHTVFTEDARFKDPFNDVRGLDKIDRVFTDMFKTVGTPDFHVTGSGWNGDATCYLRWRFTYRVGGKGETIMVEGMSDVTFAADGKVSSHIDFWDAAQGLYEHLPVIGAVLRMLRRRVQA